MCVFETLWASLSAWFYGTQIPGSDLWPTKLDFNNRIDVNRKLEVLVILFFGFHIYLMMKALTWGTGGHICLVADVGNSGKGLKQKATDTFGIDFWPY